VLGWNCHPPDLRLQPLNRSHWGFFSVNQDKCSHHSSHYALMLGNTMIVFLLQNYLLDLHLWMEDKAPCKKLELGARGRNPLGNCSRSVVQNLRAHSLCRVVGMNSILYKLGHLTLSNFLWTLWPYKTMIVRNPPPHWVWCCTTVIPALRRLRQECW
jgi:hypothetical protein